MFNFCIALYILKNKHNRESRLRPYFKLLPKSYTNFPTFYPDKFIDALKESILLRNVSDDLDLLIDGYKFLKNLFKHEIYFRKMDFLRTYYAVNSRNTFLDSIKKLALVPIGDLFNYNPIDVNLSVDYNKSTNEFEVKTLRDIKEGETLSIDYGLKGNRDYLLNYGFTVEDPTDLTNLIIRLENGNVVRLSKRNYDIIPNSMKISKKNLNPMHSLVQYAKFLQDLILKYPTSLNQDKRKLRRSTGDINPSEIDVMRVLKEEKEIVYGGYDVGNALIHLLSYPEDDAKLKAIKTIDEPIWVVIKNNSKRFNKEINKHKFKIFPVGDYRIYEREDITNFLKQLVTWETNKK